MFTSSYAVSSVRSAQLRKLDSLESSRKNRQAWGLSPALLTLPWTDRWAHGAGNHRSPAIVSPGETWPYVDPKTTWPCYQIIRSELTYFVPQQNLLSQPEYNHSSANFAFLGIQQSKLVSGSLATYTYVEKWHISHWSSKDVASSSHKGMSPSSLRVKGYNSFFPDLAIASFCLL